jgi:hypothetical protein
MLQERRLTRIQENRQLRITAGDAEEVNGVVFYLKMVKVRAFDFLAIPFLRGKHFLSLS